MKLLDGIVVQYVVKIIVGVVSDVDKVCVIYVWIVVYCYCNMDIVGCGLGDVVVILISVGLGGKCVDLNGFFVVLVCVLGVFVCDIYGVWVVFLVFGFKQFGVNSVSLIGVQYCWLEVWLLGFGWVVMDFVDVLKVMCVEIDIWIKDFVDLLVMQVNVVLFGNWEGNWVGYNIVEDLCLIDIDQFLFFLMYLQVQIDGQCCDELDVKVFVYQISML